MIRFLLFSFLVFIFSCGSLKKRELSPEFAKWAAIKAPSAGEPLIYGTYQAGCIAGAKTLPLSGPGFYVIHRARERYYGHPTMIDYLLQLGSKIHKKKYPTMMIGDISLPRGGPFLSGHASHQVGLDVDINLTSAIELPADSEAWLSPSYVNDRKVLLPEWGIQQVQLVELAADSEVVNRIFVAPAIKKYFCENFNGKPWLHKLRSWWGHDDHIHVRLSCPADGTECKAQAPLDPTNDGCGTDLAWWYSAEADSIAKQMESVETSVEPEPKIFPILPQQCEALKTTER